MSEIEIGDIVQLDPASELGQDWGPQLCVVERVKPWGVQAYWIHASQRGRHGPAYLRIPNGTYFHVGRAEWTHLCSKEDLESQQTAPSEQGSPEGSPRVEEEG